MKTSSRITRKLFFSFVAFATAAVFPAAPASAQTTPQSAAAVSQAPSVPARITQAIDETNLVTLKGNVHPLARLGYDQGALDDSTPLSRMLLLLQRSSEQEASLRQLLDDQQTKGSPNFHKWLTPEQFGEQFGPADADIDTVTQWLTSHGFQNIQVGPGRTVIEFSGTAGGVKNAFHAQLHNLLVNGELRISNVNDPQIPAALSPVVAGVVSLNNFPKRSYLRKMQKFQSVRRTGEINPLFTFTGGPCGANNTCLGMGPADFATIYNLPSSWNRNNTAAANLYGTGQSIAIVEETNINIQDVEDFRSMFGLPVNNPTIVLNGPDPGILGPD
ncbi:MAG: protease pro-enzyme activation domain-containing protein, partial [Candidatus Acidiferrum sp.]